MKNRWENRKPTQLEIETMIRMLRESGFSIAADMIESLAKETGV